MSRLNNVIKNQKFDADDDIFAEKVLHSLDQIVDFFLEFV
jgi:hypothetical protein